MHEKYEMKCYFFKAFKFAIYFASILVYNPDDHYNSNAYRNFDA